MADLDRKSREQETRAAEPVHEEYPEYYEDEGLLSTKRIPPREGFVQRWVRTSVRGEDDQTNVFNKINRGWRPRLLDSVPQGSFVPKVNFEGSQVIGHRGSILMERPVQLHERQKARIRQETKDLMMAVKHNIFQETDGNTLYDVKTQTEVGRKPMIDD